jgi:hypothetical protein
MSTNLDRFKTELKRHIDTGQELDLAIKYECFPEKVEAQIKKQCGEKTGTIIKEILRFKEKYQPWYSEALALVRQLLPDRVTDFIRHYEKPKGRENITFENYRIDDYLQGVHVTRYNETVVGTEAAIPHFEQQLAIVQAAQARFDSSLFEIRQLVQADLLDSELAAAEELAKNKFVRAAGALAGVVLEKHLAQVCQDRKLSVAKKNPTISDFNESLKTAGAIDVPQWRFIQHLADIRNLCDHARKPDPTPEQVVDLLDGVKKIAKTVY